MEICGGIPRQLPHWKLQQSLDLAPSLKSNMKGFSSSTLKDSKLHFPKPKLDSTTVAKRLLAQDGTKAKISKTKSLQGGLSLSKTFLQSINLDGTQNVKTTEKKEPEVKREISTLLEGWQVVLDLDNRESSFKERQKIKNEILDNGGLLGFSVSKKTTHVLVSNVNKKSYSFKCRSAQKFGIPVVRVDYLSDCLENGRILDIAPYVTMDREVSEENKENSLISGKIKGRPRAALDELPEKSENRAIDVSSLQWIQFDPGPDYQIAKSSFFANIKPFRYSKTFASSEKGGHQLELHVLPEKNLTKKFRIYWQSVEEGCTKFEYCCLAPTGMVALKIYTTVVKWLSSRESGSSSEAKWLRYGSPKFRKMYIESLLDSPFIDDPVQLLVDMVWQEAVGSASSLVDMEALTKEKLQKSEVILAKIKALLMDGTTSADILKSKSKEFYQQISYTNDHEVIDTKQKLNKMQDTLLLLQDVMNVQEATNWKRYCDLSNKYRSLRCHIEYVPHHTVQYREVMDAIGDEVLKRNKVGIQNVFSLTRPIEESSFSREGKKMLPLFHATRATSLLGILSRGLLLPKVVEDDIGIERRDFGFLGQGIYFADDISANLHFAEVSSLSNTKFLFMCEVAVGKQYQTWQHQRDLTKPPQGFDSVLGMKNSSENPSSFKHNEYTVYDVSQQRLSYLIELIQDGEQLRFFPPSVLGGGQNLQEPPSENQAVDVSDVMDVPDPLDKVTPGLQTDSGEAILLESVSVKAKMMDLIAQVTVFQRYRNCNTKPIEAKYVFPLDDTAAVCGFEAFIGDKHIVGKVKEKEVAHKEYREAVSKGHGAYLMDEEAADVFTVSVGNLPPSTEVIIKITYVVELSLDGDRILFNLPGSLASWRKKGALSEETQDVTSTVTTGDDDEIKFDICLSIEMPFDIKSITCPSHLLKIKRTAAKACITLEEGQNRLREGFQLLVKLHKIHHPHMWVEQHPTDRDSQACMLTFYPEFEVPTLSKPDVTVILDCSNSMKGECFEHAQKVCLMILSLMPPNFRVNLVKFGTAFAELYPSSQSRGKVGLTELKEFLSSSSPSEGNTDIWRPLHSNYLLQSGEEMRNLFLVTDGHIDNEAETLKNIATNSKTNRIFTFGVGSSSNKHMLKLMAHRGNGAFEFFDGKTKSTWMKKVRAQLKRASQPSVSSLSITWHQYDHNPVKSRQAPRTLGALFSGSRLLVYGFVSHCTSATLNAVINNQEISTIVSTSKLAITTGVTLHRLTARALIRDWEDGMLDGDRIKAEISREEEKASIVSLSKEYGIITSLTSFVAIEEREKDEVQRKRNMEEKLTQLLKDEDVDILPYMDWHAKQDMTEAYDRLEDPLDISEEEESEASESEGSSVSSHLENILHGWNSQPVKSRYSEELSRGSASPVEQDQYLIRSTGLKDLVSLPDGLSSSSEDEDAERVALYTEDLAAPHKSKDFDSEFYSDLEFDSAVVDQPVEVVLCMDKDSEMEDKAINWTRRSAGVAFRRAGRKRLPEMPEVGLSTQTFKSHLARDSAVLPAAGKLLADEEKSESDKDYSLQVCDTLFGYYDDMPATETVVTGGEKKDKGARLKDIETEVRVGSADSSLAMETELVEDLAVMKPGKSSAKAGAAFRKARRKRLPEMPEVGLSTQTFKSHLARDSAALPAAGKLLADEEKSESVEDNFLQFLDFDDECLDDMDEIETVVTGEEEKDKGARPKETEVRVGSADSPIALETVRDEDFMKVKAMKSRKKVGTRVRVFDSKEVSPSVPDTNSSILLGSVDPPPPPPPAEAFGGMRSLHELAEDPVLGTSKRLSLGFASAEPQRLSSRTPRAPRAPQHIGASLSFSHATPPPPPGRAPLSRPPPPLPDRVPPSCLPPPPPPPGRAPLSRPPPLPLGRAPPSCLPPPPPPPAPGGPPPGRPPQGRSRPSLVPVCGVPPPVPAGGIPPQPPSAIGAPSVLPPPPQQPPRYVFGGPPPPGDGVPASFGYRPLSTSLQSPETGAPLRKSMFVDQSAAGLLPQLQKKVQFGRCSPKPPSDTPEASLLSGKEHSPIPPLTKGKVLPLSQPRQVGTSGPPPPPPPPPRASALSPTLTSILPPSVKRKSSTSPARMPRRVYESATPSLLRLDGGPKPTELPKSVTSSTEKASTAFDPINSSESVPSGGYLNRLKKSQPYQQVQTQSIEGLMPARTSHRRSFGYRLMTNLRAAPRNVSYSDIVEPKTKGYSSISSGKTSQTPIYSTEVRGPSVDSKITDEPNVDMKFELYKVPELKWSISSNTLEELFKILTKHDFISYKSCLDLCNIQVATFEAFFRHVGIFSLGQTAAIGFLDFFATWLAYVIIERVRPFFLTDLSNCKIWLEAQSKNYHVSDYQLGHSTWTEVALAMLKLKDVGFGMHFLTV